MWYAESVTIDVTAIIDVASFNDEAVVNIRAQSQRNGKNDRGDAENDNGEDER